MDRFISAKNQLINNGYAVLPNIWRPGEIKLARYALAQILSNLTRYPDNCTADVIWQKDIPKKQLAHIPINKMAQAAQKIYIIGDIAQYNPVLKSMLIDQRCVDLVRYLLNDKAICHFSNATIRVAKVGCSCQWHRDWPNTYCTTRTGQQIRLMICLDGMREGQGATRVILNSHTWDHEVWNNWRKSDMLDLNTVHTLTCPPGSIVVLGPTIVHSAEPNLSSKPRRNLIVQWGRVSDFFCIESPESMTGCIPN